MINTFIDKTITCDKCMDALLHTKGVFEFHPIRESTDNHIEEVAKDRGWEITESNHLCVNCKN